MIVSMVGFYFQICKPIFESVEFQIHERRLHLVCVVQPLKILPPCIRQVMRKAVQFCDSYGT